MQSLMDAISLVKLKGPMHVHIWEKIIGDSISVSCSAIQVYCSHCFAHRGNFNVFDINLAK